MSTSLVNLDYLAMIGGSLSPAERAAIKCSLLVMSQTRQKQVRLWGRVQGYGNDYFVAYTLGEGLLDPAEYLYSTDGGNTWLDLTACTPEQIEFCEQIRGPFSGDPNFEYKIQKDIPPEDVEEAPAVKPELGEEKHEEEGEEPAEAAPGEGEEQEEGEAKEDAGNANEDEAEVKKPAKKKPKFQIITMHETARLSHFVNVHDRACRIIPRGAYIKTADGRIVRNRTFRGLSVPQSTKLENYFKLQEAVTSTSNVALFGATYSATTDFLTSIAEDQPKGVWTVKYNPSTGCVAVQNMLFLGSLTYHKVDTPEFGQCYHGAGERNLDLCFMLP